MEVEEFAWKAGWSDPAGLFLSSGANRGGPTPGGARSNQTMRRIGGKAARARRDGSQSIRKTPPTWRTSKPVENRDIRLRTFRWRNRVARSQQLDDLVMRSAERAPIFVERSKLYFSDESFSQPVAKLVDLRLRHASRGIACARTLARDCGGRSRPGGMPASEMPPSDSTSRFIWRPPGRPAGRARRTCGAPGAATRSVRRRIRGRCR